MSKKKVVLLSIAIALLFGFGGFMGGVRTTQTIENKLTSMFSEDVKEVRQGKVVGSLIAAQNDPKLSDEWENICDCILDQLSEMQK